LDCRINIDGITNLARAKARKARKLLFTKHPENNLCFKQPFTGAKNADFGGMKAGSGSAVAYAWFVWQNGYAGQTAIEWFN